MRGRTSALQSLLLLRLSTAWTNPSPASFRSGSSAPRTSSGLSATATSKKVSFSKYEGLGNDFILIDDRDKDAPSLTPEESEKLCDRNFGVGGDGVIFALKSPEESYDFKMRIYNSDGSEPEMCGNGIRCFAQFLRDLGEDQPTYKVDTLAGPIIPLMQADGSITVDMGPPELTPPKVPCTIEPKHESGTVIEETIVDKNGKEWKISAVSMGNPHMVIFVDDLENDIDFNVDGPALESHETFPARTNVEFVQVLSPTHLKMKVWERGAGPTLACGTGTCALVVAAILAGKIPGGEVVKVTLPGGDLEIEWKQGGDGKVYMTGPATAVFEGVATL